MATLKQQKQLRKQYRQIKKSYEEFELLLDLMFKQSIIDYCKHIEQEKIKCVNGAKN